MKAINFLQHNLTTEQKLELDTKYGVSSLDFFELPQDIKDFLANSSGNLIELQEMARYIVNYIMTTNPEYVILPGGSPALNALIWKEIGYQSCIDSRKSYIRKPCALFAHSIRESVDQVQPDGSVKKVAVFKHCHFIEVAM